MANKNNILIGLGIIAVGGAAYYFMQKKGTTTKTAVPAPVPTAPKSKATLLDAINANSDPLIYRGKIITLNALLKLGFNLGISSSATDQLKNFYSLWKNTPKSMDLPYGNIVDKSNIDYYLLDLGLHKSVLNQLTKM